MIRNIARTSGSAKHGSDLRCRLVTWDPLAIDDALLEEAWNVQDRYGFSLWDAGIVAAARRLGCSYLLTEDLQAGQDLGGLMKWNMLTNC